MIMGIDLDTARTIKELGIGVVSLVATLYFTWRYIVLSSTTNKQDRKENAERMDVQAHQFFDELKNQASRCQEELAEVRLMQKQERSEWMEQSTKERMEWLRKITEMHTTQIQAMNELSELIKRLI